MLENIMKKPSDKVRYEIERGIPAPPEDLPRMFPFKFMEIGDSFFVHDRPARTVRVAATKASKQHGHKYVVKVVDGGTRCWRIE